MRLDWEALDDPALVVPRVMDVRGTLLRLGFKPVKTKRVFFYRQFVPLFSPVPVPLLSRHISHVDLVILPESEETTLRIFASYGYPERYRKKLKIIEDFKKLVSEPTTVVWHLRDDDYLRDAEKALALLISNLTSKRVDCAVERDSESGLVLVTVPEHTALETAVHQTLCSPRARESGEWWIIDDGEPEPAPTQREKIVPVNKYSRLPNFDRRSHLRRIVRRPV